MEHHFTPTRYHTTLGPHPPVLRVGDGDTLVITTVDAWGVDHRREQVTPRSNPQTGPFYVEGAEPGDTLAVDLEEIRPNRSYGFCQSAVAANVVDPDYVRQLPQAPHGGVGGGRREGDRNLGRPRIQAGAAGPSAGAHVGVLRRGGRGRARPSRRQPPPSTAETWTTGVLWRGPGSISRSSSRGRCFFWETDTPCRETAKSWAPGSRFPWTSASP